MKTKKLTTEVQRLTWAMLDECATARQIAKLETLLLNSGAARRTYLTCMQMHADLRCMLGGGEQLMTETLAKATTAMPSAAAAVESRYCRAA